MADGSEKIVTFEFDAADEIQSTDDALKFLEACLDEDPVDGPFLAHALGVVARAQNRMAIIAGKSGLSRESLYKSLSGNRDPSLSTVLKVIAGLGLRLAFLPSDPKGCEVENSIENRQGAREVFWSYSTNINAYEISPPIDRSNCISFVCATSNQFEYMPEVSKNLESADDVLKFTCVVGDEGIDVGSSFRRFDAQHVILC